MILELQEINLSETDAHTTIKKLQQPKSQRLQIYSISPTKKTGLSPFFHFLGNFYVLRVGACLWTPVLADCQHCVLFSI
jgi:hypothetical protein